MSTASIDSKLQVCLKQIESTLDWIPSEQWRHSHFEKLSNAIENKTSVLLSITTLKRIWGKVHYSSAPSLTTLNTLARFLDFDDWDSFIATFDHPEKSNKTRRIEFKLKSAYPYLILGGLACLIFIIIGFNIKSNEIEVNTSNVAFDFQPISTGIPNTVTFTYDLEGIGADSFFIQQSWDPRLRHRINSLHNFHAVTYYYPGFFKAKIIGNEKILVEKDLMVSSEGWMGVIENHPVPVYLSLEQMNKKKSIAIDQVVLNKIPNLSTGEYINSRFYLVGAFEPVPADSFQVQTTFKHIKLSNNDICRHAQVILYTTAGAVVLPFSIKGCAGELEMFIPGRSFSGSSMDLSAFGHNFTEWVDLRFAKRGKELKIYINEILAFATQTDIDYGVLAGVKYNFLGGGAVQSLQVSQADKIIYQEDFSAVVQTLESN